jgi:hypothetical protein
LPLDDDDESKHQILGTISSRSSIFGLRNVPAAFQRMLDTILANVLWLFVVVYV